MNNFPTYKLGNIIDKVPIEFKVKQKEYLPNGKFPVVDQGQDLIGGFVDDESLLVKTELPVIVFGDHTKAKKFIDFPFVAGADGTKIIKPKKDFFIEPKLFYWFLHCVKFPDKGYARHFQYLLKSDIAVPPLPTQQAIVTRIESIFAELDKAVQHLRTAQQQLKTYRQAVLNHWLNNDDGKWETVKLGEVAEKIQIGPFGTQLHKSDYINGGIPLINPMHISNNKIQPDKSFSVSEEKYKKLSNYYLQKDDVILGRRGEMGRCAVVSEKEDGMLCGTGSLYIRGGSAFCADYLCKLLCSQKIIMYFENASSGTTMSNLNRGIIENCEIPLPPLTEQQRIVKEIESRLSQASTSSAYIENALQQAEALRQSILKKAFSGELV